MTNAPGLALAATLLFATVLPTSAAPSAHPDLAPASTSRGRAPRHWTLHHPRANWKARIPELQAIAAPGDRREALRSWIEFLHRTEAAALSTFELVDLLPGLTPAGQTSLGLLNLHWLKDDAEAQAVLEPWIPRASYPRWVASLAAIGQVPEAIAYLPDVQDLEDDLDFDLLDLKPLARSGLEVFLEGRATPRQLEYWMGMQNSNHGLLGRKIATRVMAADPTLRGLEADCGFRAEGVHPQAKIIFFKFVSGYVREATFRSWFRMAGDPELTECLVERLVGP